MSAPNKSWLGPGVVLQYVFSAHWDVYLAPSTIVVYLAALTQTKLNTDAFSQFGFFLNEKGKKINIFQ